MACGALALLAILLLPLQQSAAPTSLPKEKPLDDHPLRLQVRAFARKEGSQQLAARERTPVATEQALCVPRTLHRALLLIEYLKDVEGALDQSKTQLVDQLQAFALKWGSWHPAKLEQKRVRIEQALCVTRDPVRAASLVEYLQCLDRAQEQLKPLRAKLIRVLWMWSVVGLWRERMECLYDKGVVQGTFFILRTQWIVLSRWLNDLWERARSRRS
jgi:hypothetical protein